MKKFLHNNIEFYIFIYCLTSYNLYTTTNMITLLCIATNMITLTR